MSHLDTALAFEHVVTQLGMDASISSAVGGRIYAPAAPGDAGYPLITISAYGATRALYANGDIPAGAVVDVQVRVVGPADSLLTLSPIRRKVIAALHATGPVDYTDGHIAHCVNTESFDLPEIRNGKPWMHLITTFNILMT